MRRIIQSLCERVGFSRVLTTRLGESHTIRTEVTVEREEVTVQFGCAASGSRDACPMCGYRLVHGPANKARGR
jgi:hypothetical protein